MHIKTQLLGRGENSLKDIEVNDNNDHETQEFILKEIIKNYDLEKNNDFLSLPPERKIKYLNHLRSLIRPKDIQNFIVIPPPH